MTGILNRSSATRPVLCVVWPVLKRNANFHCLAKQVRSVSATLKHGLRTLETASDAYEGSNEDTGTQHICLLRGFSYNAVITPEKIMNFLPGVNIVGGADGIHIAVVPNREKRPPSIQVFVELKSKEDVDAALKNDGNHYGTRYIEIFKSNQIEMKNRLTSFEVPWRSNCSVKVTRLPVEATDADVKELFSRKGLDIFQISPYYKGDWKHGAIVQFTSEEVKQRALELEGKLGIVQVEPISSIDIALSDCFYGWTKKKESLKIPNDGRRPSDKIIVSLWGIPYGTTADDIIKFLGDDVNVVGGRAGVYRMFIKGHSAGEAFVEVKTMADLQNARAMNGMFMDSRCVSVDASNEEEMWDSTKGSGRSLTTIDSTVVKLNGLPFRIASEDIINFFSGLEIAPGGIVWIENDSGIKSGSFVRFTCPEDAEKALERHMKYIGNRYIEVLRSSEMEADIHQNSLNAIETSPPASKFAVYLRGLPYMVTKEMVSKFFEPLVPTRIDLHMDSLGRITGTANVYFSSNQDVTEALKKDYHYMDKRYIEVLPRNLGY